VIRQAISCDICGSEKKQTNHWFVAYDQSGELRISGWLSRKVVELRRQYPGNDAKVMEEIFQGPFKNQPNAQGKFDYDTIPYLTAALKETSFLPALKTSSFRASTRWPRSRPCPPARRF